jgi:DNA repair exonuclease SbcCD nuclease subunit
MRPFGVMADLHCHAWSAFASTLPDGVNSRLREILLEVDRCCQTVLDAGGDTVVIAGDVFHVRGHVAPSVFNPARDCLLRWVNLGITFIVIPGNHDLEGKESRRLTSAVAMLEDSLGVTVAHEPAVIGSKVLVPYMPRREALLAQIEVIASRYRPVIAGMDLFIHAGIDGVLPGVPAHGLTADALAAFGFRRVWAGDYHNAKELADGRVISIGAPVQHTWSDVGHRAGWWLVQEDQPRWFASHAPRFIEITGREDPAELPLIVDGHYVRAKIGTATARDVALWREQLRGMGARGVLIQAVPATTAMRSGAVSGSLDRIDEAVAKFCANNGHAPVVADLCVRYLAEAQS